MIPATRVAFLIGLTWTLGACDTTPSDPDLLAVQKAPRQGDTSDCPWLDGHYEWIAGNPASRAFVHDPAQTRDLPLLELRQNPHSSTFPWRMTRRESAFDAAAKQLREMDPNRFNQWRQHLHTWREQNERQQNTDVVTSQIEQTGPVFERRGVLGANQCQDGWALIHYGDVQRIADDFEASESGRYETELWLGKNAKGDLLYRADRYRIRDLGIGWGGQNATIRTSRTQEFGKAALAIASTELNWQPKDEWFSPRQAATNAPSDLAHWADALVDLSQTILNRLPEGAEMTAFQPQTSKPANHSIAQNTLNIEIAGKARNNKQVHEILKMLQHRAGVTQVELTSVRANAEGQFEFVTLVTLTP